MHRGSLCSTSGCKGKIPLPEQFYASLQPIKDRALIQNFIYSKQARTIPDLIIC